MNEDQKRRLNASVIEFVSRECARRSPSVTTAELAGDYIAAHHDLIGESGVTPEQVKRMVQHTMGVGYPRDPFAVSEFDARQYRVERMENAGFRVEDLEEGDPLRCLRASEIERVIAGLELESEEMSAVGDRMARLTDLILLLIRGVMPRPDGEHAMRMLATRYEDAVANHLPREEWMDEVEFLIAPARMVQPELDTLDALRAVTPWLLRNIRIEMTHA